MNSILYHNLNPEAKIKSKTFPNTPQGLQALGELILEAHYRPWWKMHDQQAPAGFELFFFTMIQKEGLEFLNNDAAFLSYKLTLVDSEE